MKITEIVKQREEAKQQLLKLWEASVRATHHFLGEEEILQMKHDVPELLDEVEHLVVAIEEEEPVAFLGVNGKKLEMLFVHPDHFRKEIGRRLMKYAKDWYLIDQICIPEANVDAKEFYRAMGFQVYKKSKFDENGNENPILHMEAY